MEEVSKERVDYLWAVLRNAVLTKAHLATISRRIQVYGSSTTIYRELQSRAKVPGLVPLSVPTCLLLPSSRLYRHWQTLIFCLMLYSALVTPYRICLVSASDFTWTLVETCIDFCFLLDILLTFFTAYQDNDLNLILSRRKIAWKYIKTWFFIDLLSSIPFQLFEVGLDMQKYNKLVRLMRLPRLYKLLRLARLIKMLRVKSSKERFLLRVLRINRGTINMLKFISIYVVLLHIISCLWFYTAVLGDFEIDTWPVRLEVVDRSEAEMYVVSMYWVLTTIATVGYGDIVSETVLERWFAIVVMVCCVAFYSYAISHFASLVFNTDLRTVNLQLRTSALDDFSQAVSLPDTLLQRAQRSVV